MTLASLIFLYVYESAMIILYEGVFISFMEKEWILSFLWILSALPPVDLFPLSWLHFQRLIWTWPKLSSCSGLSEGEINPSPLERGRGIQLFWLHSLHMPNKIAS